MQITVTNSDGEVITYGFDPEHSESVKAFYQEMLEKHKITEWRVS